MSKTYVNEDGIKVWRKTGTPVCPGQRGPGVKGGKVTKKKAKSAPAFGCFMGVSPKKRAKRNMSDLQEINEDGVKVWIKTGNRVGREPDGDGPRPAYVPNGRPRGRRPKDGVKAKVYVPSGKPRGRPKKVKEEVEATSSKKGAKKSKNSAPLAW